jgi:hypothetical protein
MTPKQIATWLRQRAQECPNMDDAMGGRIGFQPPGTRLTIHCDYDRDSILRVAEKYEKGLRRGTKVACNATPTYSVPSTRRPTKPSKRVFLQFWKDGEHENAWTYVNQYPRDTWPPEAVQLSAQQEPTE